MILQRLWPCEGRRP